MNLFIFPTKEERIKMTTAGAGHLTDVAQATPPIAVTGITWAGVQLQDWVLIVTLIYTLLLMAKLLRQFFFTRRRTDHDPLCAEECVLVQQLYKEAGGKKHEQSN